MIKDVKELKNFIKWCKKNGVSNISIGDITFQVQPDIQEMPVKEFYKSLSVPAPEEELPNSKEEEIDEELLFWSSGK